MFYLVWNARTGQSSIRIKENIYGSVQEPPEMVKIENQAYKRLICQLIRLTTSHKKAYDEITNNKSEKRRSGDSMRWF